MFTGMLALFFVLFLAPPTLYAQSEGIAIGIAPLSQDQLQPEISGKEISRSDAPPAQGELIKIRVTKPAPRAEKRDRFFWHFVNQRVYEDTVKIREEKRILREKWQEWLGTDIFLPYYKAKEVEDWISDKTKVEVLHLKGRLKIEGKELKYTFSIRF